MTPQDVTVKHNSVSTTCSSFIGVGLRGQHFEDFFNFPFPPFVEVHSENFMCGGRVAAFLDRVASYTDVFLHSVGMSLGTESGVSRSYLQRLKLLIDRVSPKIVSDHLTWSVSNNVFLNDLLPFPYNKEMLGIFSDNIRLAQDILGQNFAIENPSTYLEFRTNEMHEEDFLYELQNLTGVQILLDINNIYVSSANHFYNPYEYIDKVKGLNIIEYHLAGHGIRNFNEGRKLLIDTHSGFVCDEVIELYSYALKTIGKRPTILEWDNELPSYNTLLEAAEKIETDLSELESVIRTSVVNL